MALGDFANVVEAIENLKVNLPDVASDFTFLETSKNIRTLKRLFGTSDS